jgi:hypothetical protein
VIGGVTSIATLLLTGMVVLTIHAEDDVKAASPRRTDIFQAGSARDIREALGTDIPANPTIEWCFLTGGIVSGTPPLALGTNSAISAENHTFDFDEIAKYEHVRMKSSRGWHVLPTGSGPLHRR